MDFEQIAQLKEMGFTPEQIIQISSALPYAKTYDKTTTSTVVGEEPDSSVEIKDNNIVQQAEETITTTDDDKFKAMQDSINEKLDAMTKQFQLKNIQESSMPETETDMFLNMCEELLR